MPKYESQTTPLEKKAIALSDKLRRAKNYSRVTCFQFLYDAYSMGYHVGGDDQMKARLLDAQECRRKNGKHG
jgi:hypothetical protein